MKLFAPRFSFIFISIFLSFAGLLFSQDNSAVCGTVVSSEQIEFYKSIKPQLSKLEQDVLSKQFKKGDVPTNIINSVPIKAHIIRHSDKSGGLNVIELNNAINNLNEQFAGASIEFFLCDDINYINNNELCHFKKGNEDYLIEANNVSGLINIYFTENLDNDSDESICGYSNNKRNEDFIVLKNDCVSNYSSLAHEMGHFFSLIHTHGPDNNSLTTELVDGSNCDTDGDGICDTPADPKLSNKNVNNFCEYTGTEVDARGNSFSPDTKNIMSYARKACRNEFTKQQLARMYAFYITQKNYLSCPSFNADFNTDINQSCEESLTVSFNNDCSSITKWEWDMESDGIIDYTTQNPTHTFSSGIYDVTLKVFKKSKTISKTLTSLIKVGVQAKILDEDFDTFEIAGDNGWTAIDVSKSGYNWHSNIGETSSEGTGPLNDKTSGEVLGKYIYAEASNANPGDVAEFISPCINVDYPNSELEFAYHMFGNHIGELHVDIKTDEGYINDVIPPLYGSQQKNQSDDFLTKDVDLSDYTYQTINIRFRAVRGANWDGDIAIDDIFIKTIHTAITDETFKVYPNPIKSNMLYIKVNNDLEEESGNEVNFQISNLVGQEFLSGTVSNQPINVSSLSSGTYLLTLTDGKSRVVKKIIK